MKSFLNISRWIAGTGLLGAALVMGLVGLSLSGSAAWGERAEHAGPGGDDAGPGRARPLPQASSMYLAECGACHMAYPASLLPQRSWRALMGGFDDHFGENAELLPQQQEQLTAYLVAYAADAGGSRFGYGLLRGVGDTRAPLRITELAYFRHEHDEIPESLVTGNPQVRSYSQCQACHGRGAERGIFDEYRVRIPGAGYWD